MTGCACDHAVAGAGVAGNANVYARGNAAIARRTGGSGGPGFDVCAGSETLRRLVALELRCFKGSLCR